MTDVAVDYGLYQVQGPHPASGTDTLLYLGQANRETFGARFSQLDHLQRWNPDDPWTNNAGLLRFFTGRIHPTEDEPQDAIGNELWAEYIVMAERLLISAHSPPWNAQLVKELKYDETETYQDCHVLNWGNRASLLPEVSGIRHAWAEFEGISDEPLEWTSA